MGLAKRVALFLGVNILVIAVISFLSYIFNLQPYLSQNGLNYGSLAIFCLLWGMVGAFVSLLLSKVMAKWMMGVKVIDPNLATSSELSLMQTIHNLAKKAGLPVMPEVGIYESPEVNAFATGPSRKNSLVAVSSGLLDRMRNDEVEGVLAHEISHIANGDMVTMTLLQGIINAFVMFFARILAFFIARAFGRREDSESESVSPLFYQLTVFVLEMVFMVFGMMVVAAFSRAREFRADAGSARLAGPQKMISALQALQRTYQIQDPTHEQPSVQTFKISGRSNFIKLFASHPPLEQRIDALRRLYPNV
ncbi:MAG: protease HtpX [Parachlamydiaceae bacterium]|nr:protease HtpX [Parachlamydiaceae bacterium]